MSFAFPSLEFFRALNQQVADHPECLDDVAPSEAYCGFSIGDSLFVLEFDGRECAGVAPGGNLLDLDFVLAGSPEVWQRIVTKGDSLARLVKSGELAIQSESDEGPQLARENLAFLDAYLAQAEQLDLQPA